MEPAWAHAVGLVASEFGRTVAANGTDGTDHGTASAAMVLGGAVQGRRILVDWPGLGVWAATFAEALTLDPEHTVRTLSPGANRHTAVLRPFSG